MVAQDMPIITDDRNIRKVLAGKQPAVLVMLDGGANNTPLEDALRKIARERAGGLLAIRLDARANPETHTRYGSPALPALVTLSGGLLGRKVKSQAAAIRPAALRQHVAHLLDDKPLPEDAPPAAKEAAGSGRDVVRAVTDATFRQEVLRSKVPVLVDFWAPWCGPCRTISPYVEQKARQAGGKMKFVKLNVDENRVIASRFQVQSIPTFILFEGGQPADKFIGANPRQIDRMIDRYLI
jgi:thioredoxin 1